LTDNCNNTDSIAKKKRVRKRKPKNRSQSFITTPDTVEKDIAKKLKSKKPTVKVIYSTLKLTISFSKLIKFRNVLSFRLKVSTDYTPRMFNSIFTQ